MKGKILFIYGKKLFKPISRRQVIFTDEHIAKIVAKFRMFEKDENEEKINEIGFAKVATIEEIVNKNYVLKPGRYVGIKLKMDEISFEEKMKSFSEELSKLVQEEKDLTKKVKAVFKALKLEV